MNDIKRLKEFLKALKGLRKSLIELNKILRKELEGCPNGKEAVLKTV